MDTVGQWGSWAWSQVLEVPHPVLVPLHPAADGRSGTPTRERRNFLQNVAHLRFPFQ